MKNGYAWRIWRRDRLGTFTKTYFGGNACLQVTFEMLQTPQVFSPRMVRELDCRLLLRIIYCTLPPLAAESALIQASAFNNLLMSSIRKGLPVRLFARIPCLSLIFTKAIVVTFVLWFPSTFTYLGYIQILSKVNTFTTVQTYFLLEHVHGYQWFQTQFFLEYCSGLRPFLSGHLKSRTFLGEKGMPRA